MRALFALAFALAALAVPSIASAGSPCFGVGVDPGYLAAFDARSGPVGAINYNEGRFYRESQSWATPVGADPGHHSEHIHMAECIPNGRTLTGPFPLDIAFTFHNMDDYKIVSASESAVTPSGNSSAIWTATPAQLARLQAAADASGNGSVQRVFFTVTTLPAKVNGWKEVRGGITTLADGPNAIFHDWRLDARWYYIDNYSSLPAVAPTAPLSQNALRMRPQISSENADGTITGLKYHHSGWCGMDGIDHLSATYDTDCASARWTSANISKVWADTADKSLTLYVTDGGGDALLMIDPDFHNHYAAPTASCPNVDANGNCLGLWYWQPGNARHEIFGHTFPVVTIPKTVVASLPAGLHKLVFLSSDAPECERLGNPCPSDARGEWTNVEVLPFRVL